MSIFLLVGQTGEYSDRTQWNVCYYDTRDKAESHAKLANDWLKERGWDKGRSPSWESVNNPYDRIYTGCADYTGIQYTVEEVQEGNLA